MKQMRKENSILFPVSAGILFLIFSGLSLSIGQLPTDSMQQFAFSVAKPVLAAGMALLLCRLFRTAMRKLAYLKGKTLLARSLLFLFSFWLICICPPSVYKTTGDVLFFPAERKWFFDILVIAVFPAVCTLTKKALDNPPSLSDYTIAAAAILYASMIGFLIFKDLTPVYLIEMALLNIITVSALIFSLKAENQKTGACTAVCVLYGLWWLGILVSQFDLGGIVTLRMYDAGTFLQSGRNPISFLLFYFGWAGPAVYFVLLILFLALMYRFLGHKYRSYKMCYLVFLAAFSNLLIRCVFGTLYSFSILSFPVALPFQGTVAQVMDSACFGLLLYSELFENRRIRFRLQMLEQKFIREEALFQEISESGRYTLRDLFDEEIYESPLDEYELVNGKGEFIILSSLYVTRIDETEYELFSLKEKPDSGETLVALAIKGRECILIRDEKLQQTIFKTYEDRVRMSLRSCNI